MVAAPGESRCQRDETVPPVAGEFSRASRTVGPQLVYWLAISPLGRGARGGGAGGSGADFARHLRFWNSTLCAALTYSGWRLFSDEFALIDPETGRLSPAPRPISLKNAAIELIVRRYPDVVYGPEGTDIDGDRFVHARPPADSVRRAKEQAPPGWIVFPRYMAGAPMMLQPVPKAHALMELAGQSFNYNYLVNGYTCLAELVRRTNCFRLEYSNLDDVLDRLTRLTST